MQTSDGCSVELYRRLPYSGELEDIADELGRHAAVLELGCGVGRLAPRLFALGLTVTGVDNSPQMLAQLPESVEGICSSIESLELERVWPAVLLPSYLVNSPCLDSRQAYIEVAHRHLSPGGSLFIQRHSQQWLASVAVGPLGEFSGVAIHVDGLERHWPWITMTLRYELPEGCWSQTFTVESLSIAQIEELLCRGPGSGCERAVDRGYTLLGPTGLVAVVALLARGVLAVFLVTRVGLL